MKITSYITVSILVFSVVGLGHLLRIVQGWPVQLGPWMIPVWVSGLAFVLSLALATWGFLSLRKV